MMPGEDADVFYTEVVLELRKLRDDGLFDGLHEHRGSRRGSTHVDRVDIHGSVNYEFETED
jgi:hypothetical protein